MPLHFELLRSQLSVQLVDVLGIYTCPNSTTIPAIWTTNDIDVAPPRIWKISGIECLLPCTVDRVPLSCFQGVADRFLYTILLIQHDRSGNLNAAIEILFSHWQRIDLIYHRRQTQENFEEAKLQIASQQYFRLIN